MNRKTALDFYAALNDFWPLGGPQVDTDPTTGELRFRPAPNLFLFAQAPFSQRHVTPDVRQQLIGAGFPALRVQYHPGYIMQALAANDTDFLNYIMAFFDDVVYSLVENNICCYLSAIPTGFANLYNINQILGGIDCDMWQLYLQHLKVICQRYQSVSTKLFGLQLINEPPGDGSLTPAASYRPWGALYTGDWATQYQPAAYNFVRDLLPDHTIGCCSDGWENWQTLANLDPGPIAKDDNVLWEFHPIFPVPAAEEGYIYNQYEWLYGLAYPPGNNGQTAAQQIALMAQRAMADPNLETKAVAKGFATGAALISSVSSDIEYYFSAPQNYTWVDGCFKAVAQWADNYNIPRCNVGAMEFGATRTNTGFPNNVLGYSQGYIGSTRLDRIHVYGDIAKACYNYGFRQCADHLDTLDYGITFGQNNDIGAFDPLIVAALAPKRIPLNFALGT